MFFHCMECIKEMPAGQSPSDYQEMSVGLDAEENIIIWCKRHHKPITIIEALKGDESNIH